jgi:hypothetical protein
MRTLAPATPAADTAFSSLLTGYENRHRGFQGARLQFRKFDHSSRIEATRAALQTGPFCDDRNAHIRTPDNGHWLSAISHVSSSPTGYFGKERSQIGCGKGDTRDGERQDRQDDCPALGSFFRTAWSARLLSFRSPPKCLASHPRRS